MTKDEYLAHVDDLVQAGRDEELLAVLRLHSREMRDLLTDEERKRVRDCASSAAMLVQASAPLVV